MTHAVSGVAFLRKNSLIHIPVFSDAINPELTLSMETKFSDLGIPDRNKALASVRIEVGADSAPTSLVLAVGTKQRLNETPVWSDPFSLVGLDAMVFLRVGEARYFALKITDLVPRVVWNVTRIEIFGKVVGGRA